jgi:general secretion pathway protein F
MAELIRTRKDERVADVLRDALARISNGERLATALIASGALPISIQPLLQVGEHTAQLGEMLQHAGTELDRELERTIDTSLTLLQPAIVLAFGGIIALVAGAVMQTLYSVRPSM